MKKLIFVWNVYVDDLRRGMSVAWAVNFALLAVAFLVAVLA